MTASTRATRVRRKQARHDTHLDIRVSDQQKAIIQRAADIQGRSLADFVAGSASEAAVATIREHEVMRLNAEDSMAFIQAILNPPEPNEKLRAAAKDYKEFVGS